MASTGGNPDPLTAWQVVMTLGVLATIGVNLLTLARGNQTQRREVTLTDQFVTRESWEARERGVSQRLDRDEKELHILREALQRQHDFFEGRLSQEVGKVHDRVNDVLEAVSKLTGKMELVIKNQEKP